MSREDLLNSTLALQALGLNQGTSGNASVRHGEGYLITPSGMPINEMSANSMVEMNMHGEAIGAGKPSSEWRFHRDIYQARPEVGAVIHTHSMFATTLATLRLEIPAFHYMIAVVGGDTIRCSDYALFGTQRLSESAIEALKDRRACLLANHGMIAVGKTLQQALDVALEVETLCEQYWRALQIGKPSILSAEEMRAVFDQFKDYGNWNK
jgi:L-fuculose-phosphate aldolase